jgi:hypothetical protein
MIELRSEVRRSWFDPVGSRMLSARCSDRLSNRCRKQRGVFLTLTYARDEWSDARECYRAASEERHVRRFIQRLGEWLWWRMPESQRPYTATGKPANPLNARWVCKMEFQRDWFVHWHLLILGLEFIPHDVLTDLWGFGHVWIARMTGKRVRYMTKYVAKSGDLPPWLYLEPTRSVKFIRASPGFWGDTEPVPRDDRPPRQRISAYEAIGQACHRAQSRTQVINRNQHRRMVKEPLWVLLARARALGYDAVPGKRGWLALVRVLRPARPAEGGRAVALHSTDTPNPPPEDPLWPGWLIQSLRSLSDNPLDHG